MIMILKFSTNIDILRCYILSVQRPWLSSLFPALPQDQGHFRLPTLLFLWTLTYSPHLPVTVYPPCPGLKKMEQPLELILSAHTVLTMWILSWTESSCTGRWAVGPMVLPSWAPSHWTRTVSTSMVSIFFVTISWSWESAPTHPMCDLLPEKSPLMSQGPP